MKTLPHALLLAGATLVAPMLAHAQATGPAPATEPPVHAFTGKVSLYSEYEYRGLAQTSEKPALQLNLDYAHASGFYVGTFISNVKWLKDFADLGGFSTKANLEWDIFAGYKREIAKDLTFDVGYLRYEYPRSGAFNPSPNTDEGYVGLTYGPVGVKYSYSFSNLFGVPNSKHSDFLEANLALPLIDKLTLTGHVGHQRYKNFDAASYTVWKLGAVYDFGNGLNAGAYYKDTDAESALYTVKGRDWSDGRFVAFVSYSF
jgi:uncharacterized protein (TIGR02001 family)